MKSVIIKDKHDKKIIFHIKKEKGEKYTSLMPIEFKNLYSVKVITNNNERIVLR